jgi:AbiV family abortive infection protein
MRPRMVFVLASLPRPKFFDALSEGMQLVADHAAALEAAGAALSRQGAQRGALAVRAVAHEEAGKYLVLLDAARHATAGEDTLRKQLQRCSDHLAKGIYARSAQGSPASYGELVAHIDHLRVSHYLDGPNEADWIFRNQIVSEREEALYVDYVQVDEPDGSVTSTWQSPARYDSLGFTPVRSAAVELVAALHNARIDAPECLAFVSDIWGNFRPVMETHWQENEELILHTLSLLRARGAPELSNGDGSRIRATWTFPLTFTDLSWSKVVVADLKEDQKVILDRAMAECLS